MEAESLPEIFINAFADYYERLVRGETGLIPETAIRPVEDLLDSSDLPSELRAVGETAQARTVVIKLNGGLGTSMGLAQAKSLLPVRDGWTFLDIIAGQALHARTPLMLMNSFATDRDSSRALSRYPDLARELPLSFLQHKQPKITQQGLRPVSWPADPELEWCPPGHGDLYTALVTSGALDAMLNAGYEYAFVSNADNLGAVLDTAILGYIVMHRVPFLMEVADRTEMDTKGGHLARRLDGSLILRESAQCPARDQDAFRDVDRHRFFNTNNLWFDLRSLERLMHECDGRLGLPMIRNAKTVDPRAKDSTPVFQLETAMGSAIAVFAGARAIHVPRARFAPVKTTNELLVVRSDACELTDELRIRPSSVGPVVTLDARYYGNLDDFDARFPYGPPSLARCSSLDVRGDFKFGRGVVLERRVQLLNNGPRQVAIADATVFSGCS